jgi:hypothetical protein
LKNLEGINIGGTSISDAAVRRNWRTCKIGR